ncbi:MAG: hypothetical protein QOJ40_1481 [Verrucomicrobiota bacterium]
MKWQVLFTLMALSLSASGAELPAGAHFRNNVQPILEKYCFDCHADGANKGGVTFDEFKSDDVIVAKPGLWLAVLKNTRAGLMPPAKKPQPSAEERQRLEGWIKYDAFGINPRNPDPGRVTVRRLNRTEYRNTIRDLMGVDFNTEVEFPADDTGFGFDSIGDVLTVSPILLEKYMAAAKTIVSEAVPTVARVVPEETIAGGRFHAADSAKGNRGENRKETWLALSYYEPAAVSKLFRAEHAGSYRLTLELAVKGEFEFDPGKCRLTFKVDGSEQLQKEFGWQSSKSFRFDLDEKWQPGEHRMVFELAPLTAVEKKVKSLELRVVSVTVRGPMEDEHLTRPKNYDRFFNRAIPKDAAGRRDYAAEILRKFATRAFRRPVEDETVERLVAVARKVYTQPGKTFEAGIADAVVAALSSPRFLFRLEESEALSGPDNAFAEVDEYSLASRLSYFLWSTMPDEELSRLAGRGELRKNLPAQIKRMLADSRSEALVQNFTGQWLQTRDVTGIDINARAVLARDAGEQRDHERRRQRYHELMDIPEEKRTPEQIAELQEMKERRRRLQNGPQIELDTDLRRALREETEKCFAYVLHDDRSVLELIDSDYTFLNEKLAKHYGLTNLAVTGSEMRRFSLPAGSPRGGVLTEGSVLIVTSNPDRTSPVKRGLFVLDNILGTPAPPPPANVPALEVAEKDFQGHEPTLRESLTLHREKPLCASCHQRMDPIGLAFENFNALGMWRDQERKQPIDTAGQLITGETFDSVRELKHILVTKHRLDFYRCLTDKFLTYALGRGMEYYDAETIDKIVQRLDGAGGRSSALLFGVIESAPFQKMRTKAAETASNSNEIVEPPKETKRIANK